MRFLSIILTLLILSSCKIQPERKVLYINSYHQGYGSSDDITQGIREVFNDQDIKLKIFYMDSKRNNSQQYLENVVREALELIQSYNPDLIIASDDNAVSQIVAPFLKETHIPVVFCGVNWSCEPYGLPVSNITGMLEMLPFREGIEMFMPYFPDSKEITIISENTASEQKNIEYLEQLTVAMNMEMQYILVDDFNAWKEAFTHANFYSDMIYMPTNGAIKNWDHEEAVKFIKASIKVPVLTCDDFMMPYCVFGLTKIQQEQGIWAAETALKILQGQNPKEIPVARNQQTRAWFNKDLAEIITFEPGHEFIANCTIIDSNNGR